jgi:MGT family glycosyltransferase
MAIVAVLFDHEEGHFFTSFKLAKQLAGRGHEICYLGLASAAPLVRQQGFDLIPVYEQLLGGSERIAHSQVTSSMWFGQLIRGEALDAVMARLKPDLVIMLSLFYPEALAVQFRYRVPIVLWTTFCRPSDMTRLELIEDRVSSRLMNLKSSDLEATLQAVTAAGHRFGSFKELAALVSRMPEMVVMPRAIELPGLADEANVFYVGTGIDPARREESFPWGELAGGRYLVYCSLGSQCELEPESAQRFFRAVLGAAAVRPDWQFILSVGTGFDPAELAPVPANVYLSRWVPQLEVLRRADLVVNHGGMGTIKETILAGVPMVVLPLMRDQFEMALRVVHHRLGVAGSIAEVTAESLGAWMGEAAADSALKARVADMRRRFLEEDRSSVGVDIVEAALAAMSPGS